jgi:hypothetical protein
VSPAWEHLLWRSLPVGLLLIWFLALIGGYGLGGLIHLLLLAAVAIFGFQLRSDASA